MATVHPCQFHQCSQSGETNQSLRQPRYPQKVGTLDTLSLLSFQPKGEVVSFSPDLTELCWLGGMAIAVDMRVAFLIVSVQLFLTLSLPGLL